MIPPVLVAVIAGLLIGGGGVLAVWGWVRPALSLAEFERVASMPLPERPRGLRLRSNTDGLAVELELCEMTPEDFVRSRLLWALLFAVVPVMFLVVALVVPGFPIRPVWFVVAVLVAPVAGWFYAVLDLRSDAQARRAEFTSAIATYLDLVAMLVAGGSGIESALYDAVDPGRGAPFRLMRRTLSVANVRHESPWEALGGLASRLGLMDLEEFCSSMELASGGSQVQQTLRVRAKSLRERELTAEESEANAKSETMVFPVVLMFTGFLLLIGYPTIASLMSSAG